METEGKKVAVVVAVTDIPFGTNVIDMQNNEMVAIKEIPAKYVVSGALQDFKGQQDKVLIAKASKGEQLTTDKLRSPTKTGLKYRVPKGFRAMTIPVNEVTGVAGMVIPGSYVDVVVSFKPGPDDKDISKIMLRNVVVLAVGKAMETEEDKTQTEKKAEDEKSKANDLTKKASETEKPNTNVTLALTPPDVEKMAFAEEYGNIWLTLAPSGNEITPTPGQTMETVLK